MALFGRDPHAPDPKDEMISLLKDERDYLRAKVKELEQQLLAINNVHAYRLLHQGEIPEPESHPLPPTAFEQKSVVYTPDWTLSKLERAAKGQLD